MHPNSHFCVFKSPNEFPNELSGHFNTQEVVIGSAKYFELQSEGRTHKCLALSAKSGAHKLVLVTHKLVEGSPHVPYKHFATHNLIPDIGKTYPKSKGVVGHLITHLRYRSLGSA